MVFKEVSPTIASDELERGILDFWERERIGEKILEQRKGSELFSFYDGPPYATGKPHYGHVLQSAIKDTMLRYKTMQGYYVPRRVGWDCHGLPVEVLVEKELGFKSKKDIEALGIAAFNQKCRAVVFRYMDDFTRLLKRVGRWADYEGAYATLNRDYMEKEWGVFKQLWDKGLVHKAFRSTAYCVRCGTPLSNHEVTMGYKEKEDETVYVMLPVTDQKLTLLIWSTTPWTLPGNAAVAFNPELKYVTVKRNNQDLIVAEGRVKALFGDEAKVTKHWTAQKLQALKYQAPYSDGQRPVVPAAHVTSEDGTGLVHTAPAFGEEDFVVGQQYDLPVRRTVDLAGKFTADVPQFAGQHIFKAGAAIVADLEERGLLFKKEKYRHNYPFCWRCDTPLIYYALDTWFIKVTTIKERMIKLSEHINWIPSHVKHGRFGKGLESAPDWAVSRSRFWGVPLPVWECDACECRIAVGSVGELKELSGTCKGVKNPKLKVSDTLPDLHRPYVDEISWACKGVRNLKSRVPDTLCAGTMKRVPEVLDVWFDAGSMPYASGVPGFPADFIVESIEMTRAWFYFLHVLATATKDSVAFKNVIASGLIFAEDGAKLSKRLKNYPEPEPVIQKYGADVLRFYLLASTTPGEPYRFSERALRELKQNMYRPLWNVFSFFTRYARVHKWAPAPPGRVFLTPGVRLVLDRWVLARFKQLQQEVIRAADAYQIDAAARAFPPFIDDLSNWYVRRSRARFQSQANKKEAEEAFSTLYYVLVELSKLLAPFMPFVAEEIYKTLTDELTVHGALLPKLGEVASLTSDEEGLLETMATARTAVSEALKARAMAGIKVRQPLRLLEVTAPHELRAELVQIIQDEVNVKTVTIKDGLSLTVQLDTTLTPELKQEGWVRDIIRQGQVLRKQAGYALDQRIGLVLRTTDSDLKRALRVQQTAMATALQADTVVENHAAADAEAELAFDAAKLTIGVFRL